MSKKKDKIIENLLEGCVAALAALKDRTKSPRRISANVDFLEKVITEAKYELYKVHIF